MVTYHEPITIEVPVPESYRELVGVEHVTWTFTRPLDIERLLNTPKEDLEFSLWVNENTKKVLDVDILPRPFVRSVDWKFVDPHEFVTALGCTICVADAAEAYPMNDQFKLDHGVILRLRMKQEGDGRHAEVYLNPRDMRLLAGILNLPREV